MEITAKIKQMLESDDVEMRMLAVSLLIPAMKNNIDYHYLKQVLYAGAPRHSFKRPDTRELRKIMQKKHLENVKENKRPT